MNKKLMAVAVAAALAAPAVALAQASSVQIYGRANVGFSNVEADGAADSSKDIKSRNQVFDQGSRLGFRGTENLGGGLKAVFQLESGVNFDTGSQTGADGAANASTGFFASRDSYAGIGGNWGQVTFGRQSVWWTNANDLTQAAYINVGLQFATGGFGKVASPSARTNNVVAYQSPTWGGFSANLAYAPQSEAAGPGLKADGNLWGVTLLYRGTSPLTGQFDYARKDTPSANSSGDPRTKTTGAKLGLGWAYTRDANLSIILIRLENDTNGKTKQNGWQLNWTHMFGNLQAMAQAGALADIKGVGAADNTGAKGYLVSAKYHLSKRTGVYASYTQLKNESGSIADYNGGNMGVAARGALPAGADPRILAVGVLHNF